MQNTLFNVNEQSGKKKCIQCDVFFDIEKFAKRGKDKNGNQKYSGSCLVCKRQKDRAWRLNNPDRANSHRIKYVESEKGKKRRKVYSERKKKEREPFKKVHTEKDKVISNIRSRMRNRFYSAKKNHAFSDILIDNKLDDLIGTDWRSLTEYLEGRLQKKLTLETLSKYHIDHILPLFRSMTAEEYKDRIHYTNLELLTPEENEEKWDLYDHEIYLSSYLDKENSQNTATKWLERNKSNIDIWVTPPFLPYTLGYLVSKWVEECYLDTVFKNKKEVEDPSNDYHSRKTIYEEYKNRHLSEKGGEAFNYFLDNDIDLYLKRRNILLKNKTVDKEIINEWKKGNFLSPL